MALREKHWRDIVTSPVVALDEEGLHYLVPNIGRVRVTGPDCVEARRLGGNPLCGFWIPARLESAIERATESEGEDCGAGLPACHIWTFRAPAGD